jgi:hypothetical protein
MQVNSSEMISIMEMKLYLKMQDYQEIAINLRYSKEYKQESKI